MCFYHRKRKRKEKCDVECFMYSSYVKYCVDLTPMSVYSLHICWVQASNNDCASFYFIFFYFSCLIPRRRKNWFDGWGLGVQNVIFLEWFEADSNFVWSRVDLWFLSNYVGFLLVQLYKFSNFFENLEFDAPYA